MKILVFVLAGLIPLLSGKPVNNANLFLEKGVNKQLLAFQQTGELGKAAFKYLDAGVYLFLVEFPQQEGKWIKERPRHSTMTKAAYNPKNRTYYYQGIEGFFSIKIKGLRKVEHESFKPVFRERRNEEEMQIVIAQFKVFNKNANITVSINAITAAQFKRAVEKVNGDVSMMSIPGIK
ncbi:MAG: hypothetical protein HQ541_06880 [Mariniphaga sp.]|nr:hypothetical protein [Mariniphaga sp.]